MTEQIEINKVRVYTCNTWNSYIEEVRKPRFNPASKTGTEFGTGAIFRGHSNAEYRLSSTMERDISIDNVVDAQGQPDLRANWRRSNGVDWYRRYCAEILLRFQAMSYGFSDVPKDASDMETWAIGRHFGLLSPYLDWTLSPFVAAFFALEKVYNTFTHAKASYKPLPRDGVVAIWGLRQWKQLEAPEEFELHYVNSQFGSRMRSQQGCFTGLFSHEYVDVKDYLLSVGKGHYLERYDLSVSAAAEALYDLNLMNINYSTLFPGAFGAALHSNINADMIRLNLIIPALPKGR